jgi:hypothetical protein
VPAFLPGLGVQRDQIVVRRFEEQIVVPDADAAGWPMAIKTR